LRALLDTQALPWCLSDEAQVENLPIVFGENGQMERVKEARPECAELSTFGL
jgi:hypothetical protein